jgi:hypothetical protein
VFSADRLTRFLPSALEKVVGFMSATLESEPPLAIGLSIVGLSNARLADPDSYSDPRSFDTASLIIPFEVVEEVGDVRRAANNLLEVVWQSANVPYIPKLGPG